MRCCIYDHSANSALIHTKWFKQLLTLKLKEHKTFWNVNCFLWNKISHGGFKSDCYFPSKMMSLPTGLLEKDWKITDMIQAYFLWSFYNWIFTSHIYLWLWFDHKLPTEWFETSQWFPSYKLLIDWSIHHRVKDHFIRYTKRFCPENFTWQVLSLSLG